MIEGTMPAGAAEPCRVLMIEDAVAEAALIHKMLRRDETRAFEVVHEVKLAPGLKRLESEHFDLVLLDLNLPDMSGPSGCQRIHRISPLIPIVVFTNQDSEELALQAVREGAQDYLIKREIDAKSLNRAIRYAIERQRTEARLRESEERYALAVAGANDGIWDWDRKAGRVHYSPRWREIMGVATGEPIENRFEEWLNRIHPKDRGAFESALDDILHGNNDHLEHEHRIRVANGQTQWVLVRGLAVRDRDGKVLRMAGSISDVSRRKNAEAQLLHDAMHDALTKLPNRALFMDHLDMSLRRFQRDQAKLFATLFFDLDRFKYVNDSLGHAVGDQLLVQIAERLKNCLRPGDTLARLGGDEFAILLNDIVGPTDAIYVAERVQEQLARAFQIDHHSVYTSASVGIAVSSASYRRPEDILRDADLAMYRAKAEGHAKYAVFDTHMHQRALAQHRLETDLRRALEVGEFELHYQPIVSMDSGRVNGFEALLRWIHPTRGIVYPDNFIRVAEETGLIVPIGWWVLGEACRRISDWRRLFPLDPPLSVSVNVSGRLFLTEDLPKRLSALLDQWQLKPDSLKLEITESVVMDHGDLALSALSALKALGIQLHIDDFGTGYSSLSYLQRFRYDTLKIDRSFVTSMSEKVDSSAIVEAIVTLGNTLGMRVIAEGVETTEQVSRLRAMRCPEAQGFWFSRPLAEQDVAGYLSADVRPVRE
jgi:diguanylate cyclase (GGDEF)-like protein/PAS domain S-box-containing protein